MTKLEHWIDERGEVLASPGKNQVVQIANLVIDAAFLEDYKTALKEEIEASLEHEIGVLTLYAVFAKDNPTRFTLLEIYADHAAYESHLKTPHFLKYKAATQDMVKSLELVESVALVPEMTIKSSREEGC